MSTEERSPDKSFKETVEKLRKLCEDKEIKEKIIGELWNTEEKYSLQENKHSEERTIINDSIHGHIELHPLLVKIIDTPQFQRLRNIKQLGAGYWVYPGASHNRFEHSIGVAYLAGCLVNNLQEKQPELKITNRDKLCVQIAGLCHDLGHGPFSHLFDNMFIPEVRRRAEEKKREAEEEKQSQECSKWTHEKGSVNMFQYMVDENTLKPIMEEHGLIVEEDIKFIKELIEGVDISKEKWPEELTGRTEDKSFLYEIVSNKRNGIDVDKWDYFARDCHHLGISKSFDHKRLLKLTRVCDKPGGKRKIICFRDKERDNIYDMFCTRYNLHRQAYQHKTVNIIEIMINDALLEADAYFKISNAIESLDKYTGLTDHILEKILDTDLDQTLPEDTKKKLEEARKILENIAKRRLPKFIKEATLPDSKGITLEVLQNGWSKAAKELNPNMKPEDFVVDMVKMDHGMKGKDLTENVYFYNKREPTKAFKITKHEMTSILPERFYERLVRVYYRGSDENVRKKALECFNRWFDNNFGLPEESEVHEREPLCLVHLQETKVPGPPHSFCQFEIHLYTEKNFGGEEIVITEDCPSLEDEFGISEVHSCKVIAGTWHLYVGPNYTEPHFQVGEHPNLAAFKSIKCVSE
ncbi:deoxynucleoside triphosphate triphosphohydrolase SAMHD1-like [Paramisgurnus dabryanus]|uniref:deoxynucleoside triphosphate triphosphohydrolase SAMHD1-like n=1 Tax=Paramisgurnus dabryanus TaxID=90735 RepID=UPI003CCF3646